MSVAGVTAPRGGGARYTPRREFFEWMKRNGEEALLFSDPYHECSKKNANRRG